MSDNLEQMPESASASNPEKGGDIVQDKGTPTNGDAKVQKKMQEPEERIVALEDLEDDEEYSENEFNEMLELYDKTMTDFIEGELVVGKILAVNDKDVAVDIGFKSEGVIPIEEFGRRDSIKIGDDIEVFLDNVEDSDGQLVLSKRKADFLRTWERVIKSYNDDEVLSGVCTRRIKGGIVVDLQGVDAFLPGSQIDVKPIRDFDALIGKEMDFKIVKVNELRKNIVVSHRVLIEEGMKEQREKILSNLERGQILEGSVKNITDFGVFIDLGGVDGLLHINDLSWGRVSHPSEVVSLDEKIKIQILDFNDEKNRISLGLKQLQPHPWDKVKDNYKEGEVIKGRVVNISDYGAFMELEKGVEGLIHISEMSWTQHIKHPSKVLSLGETVDAKILNIDHEGRKISLGLKQLEPDPWEGIGAKYPVDSKQKGIVRNLTNFGAFVELEEGVDGLIHISDLSWTKKIRHPGEVLKKGDEVEVAVLNIEQGSRRISLGYKQTMDNPWDTFEEDYKVNTTTSAAIVRMIEKGVIVELPEEVDGFVPMSQLKKDGIRKPSDGYQVGDKLDLVVIEFSKENKKIILSEKAADGEGGGLAEDDQDAIAEFEKETGSSGRRKSEKTAEAAKSQDAAVKTKSKSKAKVGTATEGEAETDAKEEAVAAETKKKPAAKAEAKAEVKAEVEAEVAAEAKAEPKTEAKGETKTKAETTAKKASKVEVKAEAAEDSVETEAGGAVVAAKEVADDSNASDETAGEDSVDDPKTTKS